VKSVGFTGRHFELVGLRDTHTASRLSLPSLSSRITAVKVAADFRPEEEASRLQQLDSMNMLSTVQTDHFNAADIDEDEIRAILFGGHMRNCLDEVLRSIPFLHTTGKPVEVLLPLDLVYDSEIDFDCRTNADLAGAVFDAKADFYLHRESKVFDVLDKQTGIDYAVLFNDEPIEFRIAGSTIVQPFVLRLFSDCELLLEHLELSANIPLAPK
jgi:hypothetical protein